MLNLLRSEWYKLLRNRSFWLLLAVLLFFSLANVALNYYDNMRLGSALSGTTGLDMLAGAMGANNYIIKIGLSVLAGFFISSEYSTGTIKRAVASGYSRNKFITAKLIVFILGSMLTALVFPVANFLIGSMLFGIGDLPEASSETGYILKSFLLTLVIAAAFAAVTGAIATLLTESGKTIGTAIVIYIFADFLYQMVDKYMPFVDMLYEYSIFNFINRYTDPAMTDSFYARSVYISLLVAIAFVGIGIAVFRRKDIK